MSQAIKQIPRAPDGKVIGFFLKLRDDFRFNEPSATLLVNNLSISFSDNFSIDKIRIENRLLLQTCSTSKNFRPNSPSDHISITFERGQPTINQQGAHVVVPSMYFDTIKINHSGSIDLDDALALGSLIDEYFLDNAEPPIAAIAGNELKGLVDTHHQLIAAAHHQISEVGRKFAESRTELENEFAERKRELNEQLEIEKTENEQKLEEKISLLEKKEQELNERANSLDDRDHTHVRREIRERFKDHIKSFSEKFSLTDGTVKLRIPIHATVWTFETLSIVGIFILSYHSFFATELYRIVISAAKAFGHLE